MFLFPTFSCVVLGNGCAGKQEFVKQWSHDYHDNPHISAIFFDHLDLDQDGCLTKSDIAFNFRAMDSAHGKVYQVLFYKTQWIFQQLFLSLIILSFYSKQLILIKVTSLRWPVRHENTQDLSFIFLLNENEGLTYMYEYLCYFNFSCDVTCISISWLAIIKISCTCTVERQRLR